MFTSWYTWSYLSTVTRNIFRNIIDLDVNHCQLVECHWITMSCTCFAVRKCDIPSCDLILGVGIQQRFFELIDFNVYTWAGSNSLHRSNCDVPTIVLTYFFFSPQTYPKKFSRIQRSFPKIIFRLLKKVSRLFIRNNIFSR